MSSFFYFCEKIITEPRSSFSNIGFLLLIFSSLLSRVDTPYSFSIHYLLLPLFSISLMIFNLNYVTKIFRYHKRILVAFGALYIWILICTLASNFQVTALTYTLKYSTYFFVFISFLTITFNQQNMRFYYRVVLQFINFLAVLGFVELFFPNLWIFKLLKYPSFYPQIGSILQNPNQFGVLMAVGAILALILYYKKFISKLELYISEILFLVSIAISASRNSWLVFLLGMFLLLLYRIINLKQMILIVSCFLLCILSYPASTYKIGLGDSQIFPLFELFNQSLNSNDIETNTSKDQLTVKPNVTSNIKTKISNPQGTALSRFALWSSAINEIVKRPITGIGIGVFAEHIGVNVFGAKGFHAHNIFLNVGVELGIPGLLIFINFLVRVFSKIKPNNYLAIIPIVMFLVSQLVDFFVEDYTFTTIELYFLAVAINLGTQVENHRFSEE
jgi:hypothetical protein